MKKNSYNKKRYV